KDLTIYGNGEQTRSFQYIDDLLGGIMKMMKTKKFAGPLNLGNPEELSILDLAMTIIKLTDSNSKITFHKLPQDDPKQRCPDISLAAEILAWTPKVNLETGLKKTIDYFKNILAK
ncbi:MAG TPA: GDP-mannose 4,6-dehydratase, partial [Chitinophagaceae bacterium]|nr:GDP-mannose 4,6-dehydratase [Chitinophagaceae bacterium]